MYTVLVDKEIDKEETVMLRNQEKLNQYLEKSLYVDAYYREYVKRLNKKISKMING